MNVRILKRAKSLRGVLSFSLIYNEEWFLPHFLEHHRALGVEHFVFYDDHSTDGTRDLLMAQNDCTIVTALDEERPVQRLGLLQIILGNWVIETFGRGSWALMLDLDEFVILPPGFASIAELTDYLTQRDQRCAMAVMVDFYPERLSERFFDPLPPLQGSRWFDREPGFRRHPLTGEPQIVAAGVRARLLKTLAARHPAKIPKIYGNSPYRVAKMWKAPLLKTAEGIKRTNAHSLNILPSDIVQIGLAHFKFYPGLDARVADALQRKGYFQASVEYRFLHAVLDLLPDESLIGPASVEYRSPSSLEEAGLIWAH